MNGKIRILVVDDDPYLLAATAHLIQGAGYPVIQAQSGQEAIRLAIEQRPDLILLDVILPDLNGLEVCRQLKSSPTLINTLIVLISSAKISPDDQAEGLENLADGYIVRPINNREFLARIHTFARLKQAMSERDRAIQALLEARTWLEAELDRRIAEIERAKQQWEATVDALPHIVCLLDERGIVLRANRAVETWGLSLVQDAQGQSFHKLLHSDCTDPNCIWVNRWPEILACTKESRAYDAEIWDERLQKHLHVQIRLVGSAGPITEKNSLALLLQDITESKRIHQALQESERRHRLLAEHATDMISRHSPQGNYLYVSPACTSLLGYRPDELIGHNCFQLAHPQDRPLLCQACLSISEQPIITVEYRIRHRNGHYLWVETTGKAVCDPQSEQVQEIIAVTHNIDQRKRMELIQATQLKLIDYAVDHTVKELLQYFLDQVEALTESQIGFYHFLEQDEQTISLQVWSTNTLAQMCYIEGKRPHYPIDQAGVWADCVRERKPVIHNNYASLPHRKGLPTGHVPIVRELVVPIFRGQKIVAVLGAGNKETNYDERDVEMIQKLAEVTWESVARMQAQQALQNRDAMTRALLNATTDAAALFDLDGRCIALNEAMARVLGRSADELIGQCIQDFLPTEDIQSRQKWLEQIIQTGRPVHSEDMHQGRYIDNTIYPVFDDQGQMVQIAIFSRDITEQKETENKLRDYAGRLRALASRLAELEEAERKQLARELHDQVGQNLTALGINLNIVRTLTADLVPNRVLQERLHDSLTLVEQTTERIRHVMADLRPPILDDYGLIPALRWYGEQIATRSGISVHVTGNNIVPRLSSSVETALFRIAQEAVTNVLKHAHADRIDIEIKNRGTTIQLIIADNGIGFDLDAYHSSTEQHWGIMTMIERAEAVGAHCHIESAPGRGTQVIVEVAR